MSQFPTKMTDLSRIMDLILWRHADAVDGIPDISRELTAKGTKHAHLMADWINARIPDDTRILVSPAIRALQTADALKRPYIINKSIAPEADVMSLLLAAGWPDAGGTVMLVGHQPAFGRAAMLLLSGIETDMSIKKSGLLWISNRVRGTTQQNVLRAVISPDMV
ncbi:histidine phosphatase family protein [Sulfuriferula nivalis]|uniref:Histidine phosphatase family protein n=2 Tax=Sulfuriferula nivalis TaxID=2675298 RepID=A0A809RI33_9PROT|nr:histidine phosphatase family protein [Sulfuriferula nivalis]